MKTITEKLSNGNTITYKEIDGTFFHAETSDKVCAILNEYLNSRKRLKLYYGDNQTGKDWNEEHDTIGTVGRSTGKIKIPLLIATSRSSGGGAIMDDSIVKIKDVETGRVLFQHPTYNTKKSDIVPSDLPEYSFNLLLDGEIYSRHKTLRGAQLLQSKLS